MAGCRCALLVVLIEEQLHTRVSSSTLVFSGSRGDHTTPKKMNMAFLSRFSPPLSLSLSLSTFWGFWFDNDYCRYHYRHRGYFGLIVPNLFWFRYPTLHSSTQCPPCRIPKAFSATSLVGNGDCGSCVTIILRQKVGIFLFSWIYPRSRSSRILEQMFGLAPTGVSASNLQVLIGSGSRATIRRTYIRFLAGPAHVLNKL